jgi:hypothetical protein
MAPFFTGLEGYGPDESVVRLSEVFHLEDQLAGGASGTTPAPPTTTESR